MEFGVKLWIHCQKATQENPRRIASDDLVEVISLPDFLLGEEMMRSWLYAAEDASRELHDRPCRWTEFQSILINNNNETCFWRGVNWRVSIHFGNVELNLNIVITSMQFPLDLDISTLLAVPLRADFFIPPACCCCYWCWVFFVQPVTSTGNRPNGQDRNVTFLSIVRAELFWAGPTIHSVNSRQRSLSWEFWPYQRHKARHCAKRKWRCGPQSCTSYWPSTRVIIFSSPDM